MLPYSAYIRAPVIFNTIDEDYKIKTNDEIVKENCDIVNQINVKI